MSGAVKATRSVLVVGDGIVGLAAAVALRRALPNAEITLVQLPSDPDGWIDRLGAVSTIIHKFHRQVGLDPRLFVERTNAEPVYLRNYVGADGVEVREASTAAIPFVEGVPIHQIWLCHRIADAEAMPDFAAMLLALRDARSDEGGFGVRFDPAGYAALLGDMVAALHISRHDSADIQIAVAGGIIQGVTVASGETLNADLYVDAAGPRSRLLTALGAAWRDWSEYLPAMKFAIIPQGAGNLGEERLARTGNGITWQTRQWRADISPDADVPAPGCLTQSWKSNAVAIGEAAVRVPLVDGNLLGLAIEDILRVIAMLPRPGSVGCDINEYQRRTAIAYDALADWSSLCVAPEACRTSVALAETLAAFDARGRIAHRELDLISSGQWLARLMALRPTPRRIDPTALALPDKIIQSTIARAMAPDVRNTTQLRG